jgi:hypothetical protein
LPITSLEPDPKAILASTRAHWGVESFHWTLEVTFDEDRWRTRKDASALGLAVIGHTCYSILNANRSRGTKAPQSLHRPSVPDKTLRLVNDLGFRPAAISKKPDIGEVEFAHGARETRIARRLPRRGWGWSCQRGPSSL